MERSIKVVVGASVSGLVSEFAKGRKAATDFSQGISKELAKNQADFEQVGKGLAIVGAAGVLALGSMIAKSAEFDQAISYVQAGTHESAANMDLLRDAAIDAGASTVFSATESANAIEELGKAGLSTTDILSGGLDGSLDLAAAGGLGVARAAEIASTTLQQFKLDGEDAAHVADVLAAGAGKAMGSVDDLAAGLKFVGPVANSMGISLEETTGVLALFAQQGIIGEQAGTGLRGVLASLTAPSKLASEEIGRLGLNLYDAQGNFLGLQNAAGELSRAYVDMDEESRNASLGVIFGRETITAATTLYQAGAEGVDMWSKAVDDSGYAAETAAIRLDNLKGDVEAFGGALDTAMIETAEDAQGSLRGLVQAGTELIDVYNGAPDVLKGVGFNLTAVGAAAAIAGGAFFLGAPKILEYRTAMVRLRTEAPLATKAVGAFGKGFGALAVISVALPLLEAANEKINGIKVSSEELGNTLKTQDIKSTVEASFGDLQGYFGEGLFDGQTASLADFGKTLDAVTSSADTRSMGFLGDVFTGQFGSGVNEARNRLDELGGSLAALPLEDAQSKMSQLQKEYKLTDDQLFSFIDNSGDFKNSLVEQANELGVTADKATLLALATGEMKGATAETAQGLTELSGSAADASVDIEELRTAIEGFASAEFDVRAATRNFEAAIDDLSSTVATNGSTLDRTTEAGRANEDALDDMAQKALVLAGATLEQTGSQEQATAALEGGRQKLIESLGQFGITGAAAEAYADQLGLIPSNITTAAGLTGTEAAERKLASLTRPRSVLIAVSATNTTPGSWTGGIPSGKAAGGAIYGPGSGTSDTAGLFRLSNGEHVITDREVKAAGGHQAVYAWRKSLIASVPGLATGGPVYAQRPRYAPPSPQVVVMSGAGGGGGSTYAPTFNLPEGLTAGDVTRISAAERDFEMRSN
ncbi:phage tail tape measure protein [Frigoribacterium sp. CFBP9030]|uniref:phage tail tape measure protein n=1 Tax=Frigoribacterium sp. CFBP9030 TaxID=3096537 RepID=UPI002A69A21C|nr:phage tail tape measure protein [Frigoribacterium sp. CFBP9030]MDY0891883.1 phage tail tape measure protein [Frigoribacterium sp. CFBP9030]